MMLHPETQRWVCLHNFRRWISGIFFFFHSCDLWFYEPGQDCLPHWSDLCPLTISDSDGEVIIMGSHSGKLHLFHHLYGHESLIITNPQCHKPPQQLKPLLVFFFPLLLFLVMFFHKEVLLILIFVSSLLRLLPIPVSVNASQTEMQRPKKAKLKQAVWCWVCNFLFRLHNTQPDTWTHTYTHAHTNTHTHTHIFKCLDGHRLWVSSEQLIKCSQSDKFYKMRWARFPLSQHLQVSLTRS